MTECDESPTHDETIYLDAVQDCVEKIDEVLDHYRNPAARAALGVAREAILIMAVDFRIREGHPE